MAEDFLKQLKEVAQNCGLVLQAMPATAHYDEQGWQLIRGRETIGVYADLNKVHAALVKELRMIHGRFVAAADILARVLNVPGTGWRQDADYFADYIKSVEALHPKKDTAERDALFALQDQITALRREVDKLKSEPRINITPTFTDARGRSN